MQKCNINPGSRSLPPIPTHTHRLGSHKVQIAQHPKSKKSGEILLKISS